MKTLTSTTLALLLLPALAWAQDDPPAEDAGDEPPVDLAVPEGGALMDLLEADEPDTELDGLDLLLDDEPASDPWAEEEPLAVPEPAPVEEEPSPFADLLGEPEEPEEIERLDGFDLQALVRDSRLGGRLGLGAPARGTTATLYLGAQWRVPDVVPDLVDVQADLGWYFIGTHTDLAFQDPWGSAEVMEVDFTTHVFPLEVSGLVRPPVDMSFMPLPTQLFAGLGFHASVVYRHDESPAAGLALGTQLFVGGDLDDLGPGTLSPTLSWMGARRALGRTGVDGDPTRETVANLRLNIAYTLPF